MRIFFSPVFAVLLVACGGSGESGPEISRALPPSDVSAPPPADPGVPVDLGQTAVLSQFVDAGAADAPSTPPPPADPPSTTDPCRCEFRANDCGDTTRYCGVDATWCAEGSTVKIDMYDGTRHVDASTCSAVGSVLCCEHPQ